MSIKDFLLRKMVENKMKDVPKEDREKVLTLLQKNPQLFQKIAEETQALMKGGKDQMTAAMEVMKKYRNEIEPLMK